MFNPFRPTRSPKTTKKGSPMTAEELKQIAETLKPVVTEAAKAAATEANAALAQSIKSIGEQLTATNTAVEEIKKAKPDPAKPDPAKPDPGKPDGALTAEAIAKLMKDGIAEAMKPFNDERAEAQKKTASEALVKKVLSEKKLGGFLKPEFGRTLSRIIAAHPADEAAVLALVEEAKTEFAAAGVKAEAFSSTPGAEGGVKPDADTAKAKKAETLGALDAQITTRNTATAAVPV